MGPRGRPDFSAISRSCASMVALTRASKSCSVRLGGRDLAVRGPGAVLVEHIEHREVDDRLFLTGQKIAPVRSWDLSWEARSAKQDGGEGGIRTHGTLAGYNGFRDRPDRPLWHLSARKDVASGKRPDNSDGGPLLQARLYGDFPGLPALAGTWQAPLHLWHSRGDLCGRPLGTARRIWEGTMATPQAPLGHHLAPPISASKRSSPASSARPIPRWSPSPRATWQARPAGRRASSASPRPMAATRSCWPTPMSTRSTTRCPTTCTCR